MSQWYAVRRDEDVTGISGTGIIAWCAELEHGMMMFWTTVIDGKPTRTQEWLPSREIWELVHGHEGRTKLVPMHRDAAFDGIGAANGILDDLAKTMGELVYELEPA